MEKILAKFLSGLAQIAAEASLGLAELAQTTADELNAPAEEPDVLSLTTATQTESAPISCSTTLTPWQTPQTTPTLFSPISA